MRSAAIKTGLHAVYARVAAFAALLAAFFVFAVACPAPALAAPATVVATGQCGDTAYWSFDSQGTLTVTGTGSTYTGTYGDTYVIGNTNPWNLGDYKANAQHLVVEEGITSIGACCFLRGASLQSVQIAASVTSVEEYAFFGCRSLEHVSFGYGSHLETISNNAFGSTGLKAFEFPESVAYIGSYAFSTNPLETLDLSKNVNLTRIERASFTTCALLKSVALPSSVRSIGWSAFAGCEALESVSFGENSRLEYMEERAFGTCWALRHIEIPASVKTIGNNAFASTGLRSVTFAAGSQLQTIGSGAFSASQELSTIVIPASVKTIGKQAFQTCSALESVWFEHGSRLESIDWTQFEGDANSVLKSVEIPASITYIPDNVLGVFGKLERLYVGSKGLLEQLVEKLQAYDVRVFAACYDEASDLRYLEDGATVTVVGYEGVAEELVIPAQIDGKSLTEIGAYAFEGATTLKRLVLPESVESVGVQAFGGAMNLECLHVPSLELYGLVRASGVDAALIEGKPAGGEAGLHYLLGDTYAAITGCSADVEELVIPERIEGWPVTRILGTFGNCTHLAGVVLPSSLEALPESVFAGCSKLEQVVVPACVGSIGKRAFAGCSALQSVEFEPVSTCTAIDEEAFCVCTALNEISVPAAVECIGENAFASCKSLQEVKFATDSRLESVGQYAFRSCERLAGIALPASTTSIGTGAFYGCSSLADVSFDEESQLRGIGALAFWACSSLMSIELPESLVTIGDNAFCRCRQLAHVDVKGAQTGFGVQCFASIAYPSVVCVKTQKQARILSGNADYLDAACTTVMVQGSPYGSSVANATVTVAPGSVYTGEDVEPQVTVDLEGTVLQYGKDYTLTYANNRYAGGATVAVMGKGMYSGYKAVPFTIAKAKVALPQAKSGLVYDGGVYYGVPESELYELSGQVSAREAGTYVAYANLVDTKNHEWESGGAGEISIEWCINAAVSAQGAQESSDLEQGSAGAVAEQTADAFAEKPQVGTVFAAASGLRYRVTGTGASVSLIGGGSKIKKLSVPKTVSYGGVKYKVTAIGKGAFAKSKRLARAVIGANVSQIGARAFSGCKKLAKVTVGKNVKSIGAKAYASCPKLSSIFIKSAKLTNKGVKSAAFKGVAKTVKVVVPKNKLASYKTLLVKRGLSKKAQVRS